MSLDVCTVEQRWNDFLRTGGRGEEGRGGRGEMIDTASSGNLSFIGKSRGVDFATILDSSFPFDININDTQRTFLGRHQPEQACAKP